MITEAVTYGAVALSCFLAGWKLHQPNVQDFMCGGCSHHWSYHDHDSRYRSHNCEARDRFGNRCRCQHYMGSSPEERCSHP